MPKIPDHVRAAINAIVEYLAHDEIKDLSCFGPDDKPEGHIAQFVIELAEWAGGDAFAAVKDEIERYDLVLLDGIWVGTSDPVEASAARVAP